MLHPNVRTSAHLQTCQARLLEVCSSFERSKLTIHPVRKRISADFTGLYRFHYPRFIAIPTRLFSGIILQKYVETKTVEVMKMQFIIGVLGVGLSPQIQRAENIDSAVKCHQA